MGKIEKKQYEKGNKKIDNIDEALDLTVEAGKKVNKKSKALQPWIFCFMKVFNYISSGAYLKGSRGDL